MIDPKYYREVFPLTEREKEMLQVIDMSICLLKEWPSFQFLVDKMGVRSKHAITKKYNALIKKGYIEKTSRGKYKLLEVS